MVRRPRPGLSRFRVRVFAAPRNDGVPADKPPVAARRLRWYHPPMADKPKKPQKLRARLPRGLEDRGPAAISATRQMVEKIREVFERYGFEPVETPAMEFTDALGKFLPDQDRP